MRHVLLLATCLFPLAFAAPASRADDRPPAEGKSLFDITAGLEQQGYHPIVDISFDDGKWEAEAYKGDAAFELDVDPKTGKVLSEDSDDGDEKPPAGAMRLSEIIKALEEAGFTHIDDVSFEGKSWEIEAVRENQKRELRVDPKNGKVLSDRRD